MRYIYVFILLIILLVSCSEQHTSFKKGVAREIYPDMIGVNGNLTQFDNPWNHDELTEQTKRLGVANLRYPAGSLGNYWDWDRGWLDLEVPDSLMIKWVVSQNLPQSENRYGLENLKKGYDNLGFTPVFMLNMLSKDLDHSLRNLKKADSMGLPVKYVELGNELFFNLPLEMQVYPTPEDYGRTCKVWIDTLKKHFPEAKFAVIGSYIKRRDRHIEWTQRVLKYCDNADAVTYHKYSPAGVDGKLEKIRITAGTEGTTDASTATRNLPEAIAERQSEELRLITTDQAAYANFLYSASAAAKNYENIHAPEGMDIWVTEFNMRDDQSGLRGTWANALYVAKYYDGFLDSPVTLTNIHNIVGTLFAQIYTHADQLEHLKNKELRTAPWSLSPGGIATHIYANATRNMTQLTPLTPERDLKATCDRGETVDLVSAWELANQSEKRILLVNYSGEPLVIISPDPEMGKVVQYSNQPENYITRGLDDIRIDTIPNKKTITLPAYSFSLVL